MSLFSKLLRPAIGVVLLIASAQVSAETLAYKIVPLNINAEADYVVGDMDKPAVLILHGFLTTNKFHTILNMSQSLQAEGYTTLAPTLTLNIPKRQNSLKCNSIHTHTLASDLIEVEQWIKFLKAKGHKKIVLLGHSSGSQEILELLNSKTKLRIEAAIFTSLFYLRGQELGTFEEEIKYAQKALKDQRHNPQPYSFLFCKHNYYATPESFLSYMIMDRQHTLHSLKNLKIPHHTIMGGADKRYQKVGRQWLDDLRKTGTDLITIDGANHFFSSQHEFDLQDTLIDILSAY